LDEGKSVSVLVFLFEEPGRQICQLHSIANCFKRTSPGFACAGVCLCLSRFSISKLLHILSKNGESIHVYTQKEKFFCFGTLSNNGLRGLREIYRKAAGFVRPKHGAGQLENCPIIELWKSRTSWFALEKKDKPLPFTPILGHQFSLENYSIFIYI
jgi:hypothetical protein